MPLIPYQAVYEYTTAFPKYRVDINIIDVFKEPDELQEQERETEIRRETRLDYQICTLRGFGWYGDRFNPRT